MHSAAAVRLMRSRPPSAAEVPNPREFLKLDRRTRIRVAVASLLVVALLVVVVAQGLSAGIIGSGFVRTPASPGTSALTTRGFLEMSVQADGWDEEGSTPVIVHIWQEPDAPEGGEAGDASGGASGDASGNAPGNAAGDAAEPPEPVQSAAPEPSPGIDRYHAIKANARESVELDAGTYHISYLSPIDADGGIYRIPEEQVVEISAGHMLSIAATLEPVSPEEATREDYLGIIDATRAAADLGDDTMHGEAGEALLAKLQANAEAGPNYPERVEHVEPVWDYSYQDTYYWWYTPSYGSYEETDLTALDGTLAGADELSDVESGGASGDASDSAADGSGSGADDAQDASGSAADGGSTGDSPSADPAGASVSAG